MKRTILLTAFLGVTTLLQADMISSRTLVLDGFLNGEDGSPIGAPVNGTGFATVDYNPTPGTSSPILVLTISYEGNTFNLANVRHDPAIPAINFDGWPIWNSYYNRDLTAAWGEQNPIAQPGAKQGVPGAPALVVYGNYFEYTPDGFIDVGPGRLCQYCQPGLIPAYDSLFGNASVYTGSVQYTPEPRLTMLLGLLLLAGLVARSRAARA